MSNLLLLGLLFVLLTPGVLLRLPPNGNKWTVAIVHALVFILILHLLRRHMMGGMMMGLEGLAGMDKDDDKKEKHM